MTTTAHPWTNAPSVPDGECQRYYVYSRIDNITKYGLLAVAVSSALDCPDDLERRVWVEHRSGTVFAMHNPFSSVLNPTESPNTANEYPPAMPPTSSTSDAIDKELLLEGALVRRFESYVREAQDERFIDGMESAFATRVHDSILLNGSVAVAAWERILLRTGNMYETGEELLRQLGLVEHTVSHSARLRVLTDSANSADARIRDAASLGLSFLDDPSALPALRSAYSSEKESWLQENFKLVIDQLELLNAAIPEDGATSTLVTAQLD